MIERTISVISLSNRSFPSFEAKLQEAIRWLEIAATHGSDLVVLPEALNIYFGDGAASLQALSLEEAALEDWETSTAPLREAARRLGLAVTIPVLVREGSRLVNTFHLASRDGEILGSYRKRYPAYGEVLAGLPGEDPQPLIVWEGIKIGGAICFDTWFTDVFETQAAAGAQLFLIPSLWPGGTFLNSSALKLSTPMALAYPAWSRIIDIDGREIAAGGYRNETLSFGFGSPVYTASLNFNRATIHADQAQHRMVELERAYGTRVRVRFDQDNCLFFLESRDPALSVEEILTRFDLVTLQQYFTNYHTARAALSPVAARTDPASGRAKYQ